MDVFIEFINLFLLPLLTLFLYCKKAARETAIFEKTGLYTLFCVLNLIASKVGCKVFEMLLGAEISRWSLKYTVIGLVASFVLFFLAIVFTDYIHVELFLRKRDEIENEKN